MARPDLEIASDLEAMAFQASPHIPGLPHAIAINGAILEIGQHLGRRQGLQAHIPIRIDRVRRQPVAQQQVVHRSRMHDAEGVGLPIRPDQIIAVIGNAVDPLLG